MKGYHELHELHKLQELTSYTYVLTYSRHLRSEELAPVAYATCSGAEDGAECQLAPVHHYLQNDVYIRSVCMHARPQGVHAPHTAAQADAHMHVHIRHAHGTCI